MSKKKMKEKNTMMTARLTEQLDNETPEDRGTDDLLRVMRSSIEQSEDPPKSEFSAPAAVPSTETEAEQEVLRTVRSALEEDEGEAETLSAEEETADAAPAVNRPNRFYLVFAVFIIIMSIIGMVTTVRFIADQIESLADQTALKNEIALFLYPVVTVDPPAFASAAEIPESVVIESAIWKIVLTGDTTNYEKLYNTYMYVPAVDVEFAARMLFGSEASIVHQTVGSTGSAFTYEEERNTYLVPITPRYTAYSPSVTSISNVGELYTVRVDYLPPTALAIEGVRLESEVTKTMEFTLSKSKNSMTIHSLRNTTKIGDTYAY